MKGYSKRAIWMGDAWGPESVRTLSLMVWSQIFGCISFELFGHYKDRYETPIDSSESSSTKPPIWCYLRVSP